MFLPSNDKPLKGKTLKEDLGNLQNIYTANAIHRVT